MVPVWMTFSDLFKVTIIQRQITWKLYNIELYLQWLTNRKSYMIYRTVPFSMTLTDPYRSFKVTPFFDAEYLINGMSYRHSLNEIPIGTYTRPTQQCHFEWPEWLSKIFNDTMSVCRTVSKIFSVKEWRDLETGVRGRSRSLKMAQFDRSYTTFYCSAIVSIAVCCTWIITTLKRSAEGHPNWMVPFKSLGVVSYSPSIVTMAISLTIYEIFSVNK